MKEYFLPPKLITFFTVALWAVVNNAGIAKTGFMEWMDTETAKKMFDVNSIGPLTVTNAFLPLLKISHGRVVIVSSLAGMHMKVVTVFSEFKLSLLSHLKISEIGVLHVRYHVKTNTEN